MSYNAIEISSELGSVIELYEFTQGLSVFRYCSCETEIVHGSQVYKPFSGSRVSVKQTADALKDHLSFTFPRGDGFASQFIGFAPDEATTVCIYRGHSTDDASEFIVYWKGRVVGASASGNSISLNCESVFTSVKRFGLRARFEYSCRHTLYNYGCFVNKELFSNSVKILSITGSRITFQGPTNVDGYYTGGMLTTSASISRFIVSHKGSELQLLRPLNSLSNGDIVTIYPGCDHLKDTCNSKFENIENFGGFPWVPSTNPFGGSSIV